MNVEVGFIPFLSQVISIVDGFLFVLFACFSENSSL